MTGWQSWSADEDLEMQMESQKKVGNSAFYLFIYRQSHWGPTSGRHAYLIQI